MRNPLHRDRFADVPPILGDVSTHGGHLPYGGEPRKVRRAYDRQQRRRPWVGLALFGWRIEVTSPVRVRRNRAEGPS